MPSPTTEKFMKRLTLALAAAALLAANVHAQAPGDDRATADTPATSTEKAEARKARKATGKAVAKVQRAGDSDASSMGAAKATTKSQRKSAAARRKAAGADVARQPRDLTAPVN